MKKLLITLLVSLSIMGCTNFLNTENLTQKDSSNFPANVADMNTALMGIYASLKDFPSGTQNQNIKIVSELMSDDRIGGGGVNDRYAQAINQFKKTSDDMFSGVWQGYYKGVERANFVLENCDKITWDTQAQKDKVKGQAYFLRAYFYFDLCRMFGQVPLKVSTSAENLPQASATELYGQILSDLKAAIAMLPGTRFSSIPKTELGLASKWAAESLFGRVWLFYSGYYKSESLTLSDGTIITKNEAVANLEDCIANSGHALIPDFRNIWPYTYSNQDYGYAKNNGLNWIGETGNNTESVFAIKYSALGSASTSLSNQVNLFFGIRGQDQIPFGRGWAFGPVNPQLYALWPDIDIRKIASIYNVNDLKEGTTGYKWNGQSNKEETGYYQKKYVPINVKNSSGKIVSYSSVLYGTTPNFQRDNTQDIVVIRYADVLLMAAELGSPNGQKYLDIVRSRVKLPSVPLTLDNIKMERRFELAFEGSRYYDLLRWGDAEREINKMINIPVKDLGAATTLTVKFRPETRGFLPIPSDQIALSNGVLKQNAGWESGDIFY